MIWKYSTAQQQQTDKQTNKPKLNECDRKKHTHIQKIMILFQSIDMNNISKTNIDVKAFVVAW